MDDNAGVARRVGWGNSDTENAPQSIEEDDAVMQACMADSGTIAAFAGERHDARRTAGMAG